jgi:hypothetical protein
VGIGRGILVVGRMKHCGADGLVVVVVLIFSSRNVDIHVILSSI